MEDEHIELTPEIKEFVIQQYIDITHTVNAIAEYGKSNDMDPIIFAVACGYITKISEELFECEIMKLATIYKESIEHSNK